MIRKICKKAIVWLLAGVISLSAVTVQAAEVDNGASYPITTNAISGEYHKDHDGTSGTGKQ